MTRIGKRELLEAIRARYLRASKADRGHCIYTLAVIQALTDIWEVYGRTCSRRLHPFLPEIPQFLEQHQELVLPADTKALHRRIVEDNWSQGPTA